MTSRKETIPHMSGAYDKTEKRNLTS